MHDIYVRHIPLMKCPSMAKITQKANIAAHFALAQIGVSQNSCNRGSCCYYRSLFSSNTLPATSVKFTWNRAASWPNLFKSNLAPAPSFRNKSKASIPAAAWFYPDPGITNQHPDHPPPVTPYSPPLCCPLLAELVSAWSFINHRIRPAATRF